MKKLYIFLISFVLINPFIKSQAIHDSILVSDGDVTLTLHFGVDPDATDEDFDPLFNESDLPPLPPGGSFDARLIIPPFASSGLSSLYDFRNASIPFTGSKVFQIQYQPGAGTTITISWNLPVGVTGTLNDVLLGTLINVTMSDSGEYTVSNPSAFNRLNMTINYTGVVPVELISFSGNVFNNAIELKWSTATETNNLSFEIEKKSEGRWQKIGFVEGHGNSATKNDYYFRDEELPEAGAYTYRLKQNDYDGSFSYSKEINVTYSIPAKFELMQNYPNPFNPSTTIKYSIGKKSYVNVNVYNILGKKIAELVNGVKEQGTYSIYWNTEGLPAGVYFYELNTEEFTSVKKMTLLK
jgi:hypothetical protein